MCYIPDALKSLDTIGRFFTILDKGDIFVTSCLLSTHKSPSEKWIYSKREEFARVGANSFLLE